MPFVNKVSYTNELQLNKLVVILFTVLSLFLLYLGNEPLDLSEHLYLAMDWKINGLNANDVVCLVKNKEVGANDWGNNLTVIPRYVKQGALL